MGSDMEIPDELIDRLMGEYTGPEQLTGPDGLINRLRKRLIERAAGAELERHLGYPQGADAPDGQCPTLSLLVDQRVVARWSADAGTGHTSGWNLVRRNTGCRDASAMNTSSGSLALASKKEAVTRFWLR